MVNSPQSLTYRYLDYAEATSDFPHLTYTSKLVK